MCRMAVGNVPLKWYKHEEHIGYDREGGKLIKKGQRDKLEEHMAKQVPTHTTCASILMRCTAVGTTA